APLTPTPVPLTYYPEKENRGKGKEQINCDQRGETDSNHGAVGVGFAFADATSLPHSTVAIPQTSESPADVDPAEKRQRARYSLACSSSAASPDEVKPKQ